MATNHFQASAWTQGPMAPPLLGGGEYSHESEFASNLPGKSADNLEWIRQ